MKQLIVIFVVLFTSCTTSKMALQDGNYAQAVDLAWNKLNKNPENQKEVLNIEQAYAKAQQKDMDEINFLKKEGNPENWDKIYDIYMGIRKRQNKIKSLPELIVNAENRKVNFALIDVDDELIKSKQNAAAYAYTHATQLLKTNTKENSRKAYYEFESVKKYYSNYKDVDSLISVSKLNGITYILIRIQNKTSNRLPTGFEEELMRINITDLDDEWVQFDNRESQNTKYDFTVNFVVRAINLTPERIVEKNYRESKDIVDGYDFELDNEGNHKKDSAGNVIQILKYKTITCDVRETIQLRNAEVLGNVDFVDLQRKQVIKSVDVAGGFAFENHYAMVSGNYDAMSPNTLNLINAHPVPFPTDESLIGNCLPVLKNEQLNAIKTNRNLFE